MSAGFTLAMEDVLELRAELYGPLSPAACFDEVSTQLLSNVGTPFPAGHRRPWREDHEYRQEGARSQLLACEPLEDWCHVAVTERRTRKELAHRMRWLAEEACTEARLILGNLNTHRNASLYGEFVADEARRVARKLNFHHNP